MSEALVTLGCYIPEGLYWSALLLGEHLYNKEQSVEVLHTIVEAMFHLEFYERCIDVIENNEELQEYYEMCKIYLQSVSKSPGSKGSRLSSGTKVLTDRPKRRIKAPGQHLSQESVMKFYESLCTEDPHKHLADSFLADPRNFEALFYLKANSLSNDQELAGILSQASIRWCEEHFHAVLFSRTGLRYTFSPTTFLNTAKELYAQRNGVDLFALGTYMIQFYKGSEYSYFVLGLYYLYKNNYEESKKCFYKALKINDRFGRGWIGLGISYSGLKECINALECFTNAQQQMPGSSQPSLYLGFEYHKMNNLEQADVWYRKSLSMEKSAAIVQCYSAFLISNEKYSEALELLSHASGALESRYLRNQGSLDLLRCFCNLFTGDISSAQACLSKCESDWRYFAASGFIKHIQNEVEEATYDYYQALIRTRQNSVVEDLLSHAVDVMAGVEENTAFNYASDLFEALDLKYLCINFIDSAVMSPLSKVSLMRTEADREVIVALDINGTLLKRVHKCNKNEVNAGLHGNGLCRKVGSHVVYYRPHLQELGVFLDHNRIKYVFWSTMQRHNTLLYAKSLEAFGLDKYLECYDESHCKAGSKRGNIKAKRWLKDLRMLSNVHNVALSNCVLVDDNILKSTDGCNFIPVKEYDPSVYDQELLLLTEKLREFVRTRQKEDHICMHSRQ
ncbi:UNVERIFIED_CONTAM: hypothetical protein PYX00_011857 [Menopon gallinae]|uniref:FCP1 homology domain-containing protein n=1 Tax=Menopon gallinae TaxID=328185 RepID=A0AAW2H8T8_9NEOP